MERNNWNNRNNQSRNRNRDWEDNRHPDEDTYRGAYRFDNSSDHRNVSTWNDFESSRRDNSQNPDYNRNYNQDYNRDYNHGHHRGYDHDNYNLDSRYRDNDRPYRSTNNSDWNDNSPKRDRYTSYKKESEHRSVHDRIQDQDKDPYGAGNFNGDYGPDNYGHGGGENYGNMAGSLSYGYDGTSTYDPDWNSHYDPQTGNRRSYHGNYTSRHPDFDNFENRKENRRSDSDYR
jgi:hypothetical protein